jgi:hypothetical protein
MLYSNYSTKHSEIRHFYLSEVECYDRSRSGPSDKFTVKYFDTFLLYSWQITLVKAIKLNGLL